MLASDSQADEFFRESAAALTQSTLLSGAQQAGDRIGRYRLLQQIGEGGSGMVYMAEQDEPVRRRVALKVIKLGMDTKNVIARFEAERQALALMDHPNIAKVFDGGTTQSGSPFFVMELVRGVKITEYCDHHRLSTRERVQLLVKVCHAVQHAHQKGIIHRDLKPSNILVSIEDGEAIPKIIDFGIAKAIQGRLTVQTLFTAFAHFLGTPAYMSPEQALMTSVDVDTRSDIYSLGVLFYELLTGKTPFDTQELLAEGLDALRQTIREREPPRPSTRLQTLRSDELTVTAARRECDAFTLPENTAQPFRALRGVLAARFSPGGREVAFCTPGFFYTAELDPPRIVLARGMENAWRAAISSDLQRVGRALVPDGLRIYQAGTNTAFQNMVGNRYHSGQGLAFSPDGLWLASPAADHSIELWSVAQ